MAKRPQVNTDLGQPEAVRVTARPTMDRAPTFSLQQSRAGALAQSLVSIAPTLSGYVKEFQDEYQADEENRAYDTIQGMTYEQARDLVKSGQMRDTESPWYQAAFEKQFGMVYAGRRKRELVDAYNNSFDKHNGDLDSFIAEFAGEDLGKFGGSKFIMSGYREGMKGVLPTLRDQHAEWQSNWTRETVTENFGQIATNAIDFALEAGDNPMEAVRTLYADHKEAFGMTFAEMDAEVFKLAGIYAERGNLEAVEAILGYDAVGADGVNVGSFLSRPKYALQAEKLLDTARANRGEALREENTATVVGLQEQAATGTLDIEAATALRDSEQITLGEYERLILQNETAIRTETVKAQSRQQIDAVNTEALKLIAAGKAYAIQDVTVMGENGKPKTLTRQSLVDDNVNAYLNQMVAKGTAPAVIAQELSRLGVDTTFSPWEQLLSNGYLTLTDSLAKPDKDGNIKLPDTALEGYATWKALNEAPQLRSRHINNRDAEDVWAAAWLLESVGGYSTEDALLRAAAPPSEAGKAAANSFSRDEFSALADSIEPGWGGDEMSNGATALGQTEALAKFFIARGVPKKKAVEQAITDYKNSHTTINGASVNTRNIYMPQNFEDASLVALQEFAEQYDEDVDDLTLVPAHDGSNNWIVAYKGNVAMPVPISGGGNRLHVSDIERTYKDHTDAIEQQALEAVDEAIRMQSGEQAAIDKAKADFA